MTPPSFVAPIATRRAFLQTAGSAALAAPALALLAPGCAPVATPPPRAPPPANVRQAWEDEWDRLVAAAKKEGKLVINWIFSAGTPQKAYDAFEAAFPGISVEATTFQSGSLWNPKVLAEQQAGIFNWDLDQQSVSLGLQLRDGRAYEPIRPAIIRPDAMEDKAWLGGFESGFGDDEKKWSYASIADVDGSFWVNTSLVKEEQLKSIKDLTDPKWQGKMIFADPRSGFTFRVATAIRLLHGDGILKQLYVDQQPTYSRDSRLITEALVRERAVIGTGVTEDVLAQFQAQGLGKGIKRVYIQDMQYLSFGHALWLMKNAPHPNAAKLFINWLLTKPAQEVYTQAVQRNSRRTDVRQYNAAVAPDPNKKYLTMGTEAMAKQEAETTRILLDMVRL